ncbi:hypothetical protein AB1Y20_000703 [Prymnesium parvum]|uniref:Uncharacterized protein n=1 Tax=Prymnesium parvum TaxID=97485 RepID=A0AB34K8X1_PRYPA
MSLAVLCVLPAYRPAVCSGLRPSARCSSPCAHLDMSRAHALRISSFALASWALPAVARELTPNEQRQALQAIVEKRGDLDPGRRGNFNEKALFSEDFYFKYGLRPTPQEVEAKLKEQELPFSPVQRRYTGYQKFAPRIQEGLAAYSGELRLAIAKGDWEAILAATEKGKRGQGDAVKAVSPAPARSVARAYGLFANTALQSENDSTTTANLLARHLVNEYYFALDDMATAAMEKDSAAAKVAWKRGKEYVNAYLALVNQVISAKVGEKFALIDATV